jgi:hypothetical protein
MLPHPPSRTTAKERNSVQEIVARLAIIDPISKGSVDNPEFTKVMAMRGVQQVVLKYSN